MMNPKQQKAIRAIQRILKENFSHAMVSVIYRDETANRMALAVIDGTANNTQALDLAQRTLQQVEIKVHGFIKSVFEVPRDLRNGG